MDKKIIMRSLINDNNAVAHISRLFIVTGAFIFVTGSHILSAVGVGVPEFILEPVISACILLVAIEIAVVGTKIGVGKLMLLILATIAISVYVYAQYVLHLI